MATFLVHVWKCARARMYGGLKPCSKKCSCRTTEGAVGTTCRKSSLGALNKDGPDVPMSGDTW